MRLVLAIVLAVSGTLPLSVSAQAGEEGTISEPHLQEPAPSAEPAPEEPALQLKLDSAGVDVVPSPPGTIDGYTLEEMELRVRRAKIGLFSTAGVTGVGLVLFGVGVARSRSSQDLDVLSGSRGGLLVAGVAVGVTGVVGMIVTGTLLGIRKGELRRLEEAHYGTPRRVQWDMARSRLVF
jgi:hypothetical protein